jgi:nucleoside phosphorylase
VTLLVLSAWWPEQRALAARRSGDPGTFGQKAPLLPVGPEELAWASGGICGAGHWEHGAFVAGDIVLCTVGVGLVEAAVRSARAIDRWMPREVWFLGTAGAFDLGTHPLLSVVRPRAAVVLDACTMRSESYVPMPTPRLASAADESWGTVGSPLGITRSDALATEYGDLAQAENLEAYAVARAAAEANLPWQMFLGISNAVGEGSHAQWATHHLGASLAAQKAAYAQIKQLEARE